MTRRLTRDHPVDEAGMDPRVIVALPRGTASFEPIGRVEVRDVPVPVATWRVKPAAPG